MTAAAKKQQKVPVGERALIQRINRKLRKDDESVHATRPGTRAELDLGRYYIRDFNRNNIVNSNVDLEDLGRELKVLADWETLVEAE